MTDGGMTWQMTAAFSHWPSTLLSFPLLFQSYLSFLPVISVLSVISAMVSAISAYCFHLVFCICHCLCRFRPPISCHVLFLPVASTASFVSACVFCLSADFGIHLPSTFSTGWEGVGGANSAFEMNSLKSQLASQTEVGTPCHPTQGYRV